MQKQVRFVYLAIMKLLLSLKEDLAYYQDEVDVFKNLTDLVSHLQTTVTLIIVLPHSHYGH